MVAYLGIDPGALGGMALLTPQGKGWLLETWKAPEGEVALWDWFVALWERKLELRVAIERINPGHGDGWSKSIMSKLYGSYSRLRMCLVAIGVIRFHVVQSQVWQRKLGILTRGAGSNGRPIENTTAWKNRLKTHAQSIYPDHKVTLSTSDAILIVTWCRLYGGDLVKDPPRSTKRKKRSKGLAKRE